MGWNSFSRRTSFLLIGLAGLLGACSHDPASVDFAHFEGGSQVQSAPADPADRFLVDEINRYLAQKKAPKFSQYDYVRTDLNGDGRREGIVMFTFPHSFWCGWGGCTMAVFQAQDNTFSLLSETKEIRGPVIAIPSKTKGWQDISVRLSGLDQPDETVILRFDGYAYPYDPLNGSRAPFTLAGLSGTRLFP
jgi:hypothetical protein